MNDTQGDPTSASRLFPLVYDELRKLAAQRLEQEKAGQTLQAADLVHEAYLRLVGNRVKQSWEGRGHFFAAAAEAMRRILVEKARSKGRLKRGGDRARCDLDEGALIIDDPDREWADELLALDAALKKFAELEPEKAKLVHLRYFAGMKLDEVARELGIAPATADRYWKYARAWLQVEVSRGDEPPRNS